MRYNVCTIKEPTYAHKHPCSRRARTKLERVIAQIDRAVPLKVRAWGGTLEGSSAEVFMLGHALCRSNSSSEKSALVATLQIGGDPALNHGYKRGQLSCLLIFVPTYLFKKNLNASKPSEHPPQLLLLLSSHMLFA